MGFLSKLKLRDWRGVANAPARKAVLYTVDDATGEATPITADQLGGSGSSTDPASAREATLELVRLLLADTNSHAQAANGNSFILADQALNAGLKVQLGLGAATDAKVEAVRALLAGTLAVSAASLPLPAGAATEAKLEAMRILLAGSRAITAAALPLPAGAATETKLEAVRALVATLGTQTTQAAVLAALTGTLNVRETATAPGAGVADVPAASSTGTAANLAGLSVTRIVMGTVWTAADLSFETSTDGATWNPLYDAYGNLIVYKAGASRSINVPVGDLLRINRVRVRSGIPGAYVTQAALAGVTLVTAAL